MSLITSVKSPLVKQIRSLHTPKGRRESGLFLLEGTHLIQEAIATYYPLYLVCATPDWPQRHPQLWEQFSRTQLVSESVLQAMSTTVNPDGVVATAKVRPQNAPTPPHGNFLGLALETIQDPGNLGTIIRTAVATGVTHLWLSQDCVDLYHPKLLRASAGQWFRVNAMTCPDLVGWVKNLQNLGAKVVATLPQAPQLHWYADLRLPCILLVGNEGAGLSENLANLADHQVRIPLWGGVESLNVAIATAVILYEVQRQQASQT